MTFSVFDTAAAMAPRIGPFASADFLRTVWKHASAPGERLDIHANDEGAIPFVIGDATVALVGPENLVDYRSPVGAPKEAFAEAFGSLPSGMGYRFDSLPIEAADFFSTSLAEAGLASEMKSHSTTAVLSLPSSFDEYMRQLAKKERHEIRRKIRRFGEAHGSARIVTYREPGPVLQRFFGLHRLSDGAKSAFMTPRMTRFFTELVSCDGWQVDALYGDGPRPLALTVSFEDNLGYYLYNSTYDPAAREASPGVVLLTGLIELAIDQGLEVFDFLKGDEQYKYRIGAEERPLYVIEGST